MKVLALSNFWEEKPFSSLVQLDFWAKVLSFLTFFDSSQTLSYSCNPFRCLSFSSHWENGADSPWCSQDICLDQGQEQRSCRRKIEKWSITFSLPSLPSLHFFVQSFLISVCLCACVQIINAELFKNLKQIHGKSYQAFMLSKLIPVVGNVCETDLGLDEDAAEFMSREVDVIINSAATTTFHERL